MIWNTKSQLQIKVEILLVLYTFPPDQLILKAGIQGFNCCIFGFGVAVLLWGQTFEVLCLFRGESSDMFVMYFGLYYKQNN